MVGLDFENLDVKAGTFMDDQGLYQNTQGRCQQSITNI